MPTAASMMMPHDMNMMAKDSSMPRTKYDMEMMKMFNPGVTCEKFSYHAPQWPGARTQFDMHVQKKFCPTCLPKMMSHEKFSSNERTKYDVDMMKMFNP